MEALWLKACSNYDIPEDVCKSYYARIQERLSQSEPNRHYHNWNEMFLRKYEHLLQCKPHIVLAAFFQYYHFEANRNCVKENCETFEEFCRDALFADDEAKSLIIKLLGDKTNDSELITCYEDDANLLQDIDMAILGAAADDYKRYTQLLRREYDNLSDDNYKLMRLKVLQTLLMIPNIYATFEFQQKYEETARANIKQEISELKA